MKNNRKKIIIKMSILSICAKLANKPPDKKHPYGYGRIEYVTSLAVSAIVLYAGVTALVESIRKSGLSSS